MSYLYLTHRSDLAENFYVPRMAKRRLRGFGLAESKTAVTPRVLTYSTRDVIDKRISVPAQHSLVRLSKNPVTSADAVGMLEEIKAGRLAGIFCVNWKIPAQRALKFGKSWWTVIPQAEDAIVMPDPTNPNGRPLIAFRRELSPDCGLLKGEKRFAGSPARLDVALLKAWDTYQRSPKMALVPCQPITEGSLGKVSTQSAGATVSIVEPKLSFFQNFEDNPAHTVAFKTLADRQAKRISAFGDPSNNCANPKIGSTPYSFGADIIEAIKRVYSCLSKPVDEVHIFGHSGKHGIFGRDHEAKYGLYVNRVAGCPQTDKWSFENELSMGARIVGGMPTDAMAIDVKFLLHGCKTAVRVPKGYCFKDECDTRAGVKTCKCICRLSEGPGFAEELLHVLLTGGLGEARVFGHAVFGDQVGVIGTNTDWWVFSKQSPRGRQAKLGEVPYRQ